MKAFVFCAPVSIAIVFMKAFRYYYRHAHTDVLGYINAGYFT